MSGLWSGYWYENPLHDNHLLSFTQTTAVLQLNPNAPYLSLRAILASVESQRARPRYPYLKSALDGILFFLILITQRYIISIHVLANRKCSCGYSRTLYLYLRDALQLFPRPSSCIDVSARPSQWWKYWDGSLYPSNIHECKLITFLRLPSYS
jgi:hypothetical protein